MGVSIDLLTQFAKTIKAETKEDKTSTIWGTAVKLEDGSMGVRYDGAEIVTPASPTTNINEGERVLVTIKNHYAYISNNITDPSASSKSLQGVEQTLSDRMSFEYLEAYEAIFDSLEAKTADIDNIEAIKAEIEELRAKYAELDYVSAKDIEALNVEADNLSAKIAELDHVSSIVIESVIADIHELKAKNASFTCVSAELLKAVKADINQLNTDKLSAKDAEIQYANIDFSNIKMAAIEELFTKSGIIKDLVVDNQSITGELVGVTIKGDLIEAGTVVADKLVVKGTDGILYKLNIDAAGLSKEEAPTDTLHGSVITAKSIVAEKIAVEDLVAFGATIGGFHISDSSIYSDVKKSVDNTTRGIYMDKTGQVAIGDANNYLKFYKDADGTYKLAISANSIRFGVSGVSVDEVMTGAQAAIDKVNDIEKKIEEGDFSGEDATILRIESSRGTVFKNDSISTTLSAVIYRGSHRITTMAALKSVLGPTAYLQWKWQHLNEDSFGIISADDKRIGNDGFTFTLSPGDVNTKVTFICELIT